MKVAEKLRKRARVHQEQSPALSSASSSSLSPPPEELPKAKRSRRGVTKPCPVCGESIPVRLLAQHAELELHRVEELMRGDGPPDILQPEAGPSTTRRGAFQAARKSLSAMGPKSTQDFDSVDNADRAVKAFKRNRKQRHARLKEMIVRDDDERPDIFVEGSQTTCPVCATVLHGDGDFVNAHVDSCVSNAARIQTEREEREMRRQREEEDVDPWGGEDISRVGLRNVRGLRGMGIEVRDRTQQDVEDDIDIDGDDEAVFGDAQFTESDVLGLETVPVVQVDGDEDSEGETLRDLVSEGKVVTRRPTSCDMAGIKAEVEEVMGVGETDRMDEAIRSARMVGNSHQLVTALENKIKMLESMRVSSSTSSICRICLDPYTEPTVSTGCWHTCCRECWLRCLGSTKLCPLCFRITNVKDLRKLFL